MSIDKNSGKVKYFAWNPRDSASCRVIPYGNSANYCINDRGYKQELFGKKWHKHILKLKRSAKLQCVSL